MESGLRADAIVLCALLPVCVAFGAPSVVLWIVVGSCIAWTWLVRHPIAPLVLTFAALLCGGAGALTVSVLPITMGKIAFLNLFIHWMRRGILKGVEWSVTLGFGAILVTLLVSGWNADAAFFGNAGWRGAEVFVRFCFLLIFVQVVLVGMRSDWMRAFRLQAGSVFLVVVAVYLPLGLSAAWYGASRAGWTMRVGGPLNQPNEWGMVLLVWSSAFVLAQARDSKRLNRWIYAGFVCLVPIAVFQTMSRAAIVVLCALFVFVVAFQWRNVRKWWPVIPLTFVLGLLFVNWDGVYARLDSLYSPSKEIEYGFWSLDVRARLAGFAWDAWLSHPWFGVGVGNAVPVIEVMSDNRLHVRPHNSYLLVLMEQGILGVFAHLFLAMCLIRYLWQRLEFRGVWLKAWLPALLPLLFFALFADVFTFPLFWLLIALSLSDSGPSKLQSER